MRLGLLFRRPLFIYVFFLDVYGFCATLKYRCVLHLIMAKKRISYEDDFDEDDELLLDRKAKRRLRQQQQQQQAAESQQEEQQTSDDPMTGVISLCQENRWREAVLACYSAMANYLAEDKAMQAEQIRLAMQKIDRSLRRQMILAFINEAQKMLNKE